jgi:hypothetical protein
MTVILVQLTLPATQTNSSLVHIELLVQMMMSLPTNVNPLLQLIVTDAPIFHGPFSYITDFV